jgi:hypothetical protein
MHHHHHHHPVACKINTLTYRCVQFHLRKQKPPTLTLHDRLAPWRSLTLTGLASLQQPICECRPGTLLYRTHFSKPRRPAAGGSFSIVRDPFSNQSEPASASRPGQQTSLPPRGAPSIANFLSTLLCAPYQQPLTASSSLPVNSHGPHLK